MPKHKISWDMGFGYGSEDHSFSNTHLLRYGLFENVEVRASTSFLLQKEGDAQGYSFAVAPVSFGTKLKVYDGTSILPSVGLMALFLSPHLGSKSQLPSHVAPSLYLLFENEVNDWFDVCYDAGMEWDGETPTPTTFLSICLNFGITEKLWTYVESANYLHPELKSQNILSLGLTWQASRRVQLFMAADMNIREPRHYNINGGLAWLIN